MPAEVEQSMFCHRLLMMRQIYYLHFDSKSYFNKRFAASLKNIIRKIPTIRFTFYHRSRQQPHSVPAPVYAFGTNRLTLPT